jgi:hypothetical protein
VIKASLLAAAAGLLLVSASPPELDAVVAADAASYPRCSATVKDRCIQTRESGARRQVAHHEAKPRPTPAPHPGYAAAEPPRSYPPCTATRRDRCTQTYEGRGAVRTARYERPKKVQLAYRRAGERG